MIRWPKDRKETAKTKDQRRERILRETDQCTRCGNCLFQCPVYNTHWTEPQSPRGKLHLVEALQRGTVEPGHRSLHFINQCLLCGSCEYLCPRNVGIRDLVIQARGGFSGGRRPSLFKALVLFFYRKPILRFLRPVINLLHRTPLKHHFFIPRIDGTRVPRSRSREPVDILLFPGCGLDIFHPRILAKIYRILTSRGFSVAIPPDFRCCGFPHLSQGWENRFQKLRAANRNILKRYRFRYLVIPCSTGTETFRNYYHTDCRVWELTEFMARHLKDAPPDPRYREEGFKVSFHDACHQLKGLKMKEEPRFFPEETGEEFHGESLRDLLWLRRPLLRLLPPNFQADSGPEERGI